MELFRIKKDIPFMKHALVFNIISLLTFVAAVFFLVTRGLHFSIEFTGGTEIQLKYHQAANLDKARHAVEELKLGEVQVQNFGSSSDVMVRVPTRANVKAAELSEKVFSAVCKAEQAIVIPEKRDAQGLLQHKRSCQNATNVEVFSELKVDYIGPQVGKELVQSGLQALAAVILGVIIYLAIRFEWKFAVSAVVANLHDVVIILGFFAFFQWEFSLAVLAGVLAVLGYSVNESVVVFDRIRENFRKMRRASVVEVINNAITSTISRTIITHGATQMMVTAMLFLGGPTLHYFAMALTIGICFGIYSSVLVASPLVMWLGVKREDLIPSKKEDGVVDMP